MEINEKIVAVSSQLFMDFGIKGVTMDNVASNLGMSKRTLYEHFSDKKGLVAACVENMLSCQMIYEDEVMDASETVIDELFMLFKHMDDNYNKRGKMAFEIKKYYPEIYEVMYIRYYKNSCLRMKEWLVRGVKQGLIISEIDIDLTVYVIIETLNNLALRPERITTSNLSLIDSFKYVIIYFFRGISTNKGVNYIDTLIKKEK
ncbi:MAG: TetR/AcrR family transcriptional regulator [Rikenellaceae bacterium]